MIRLVSYLVSGLLITLILLGGCTDRKNIVGDDTDYVPLKTTIPADSLISYFYSYEDSVRNYYRSEKLLVGNFQENQSITLLRFANLPDSNAVINSDAELRLTVKSHFQTEGMELKIGLINQNWNQYNATWDKADADETWDQDWADLGNLTPLDMTYQVSEEDSTIAISIAQETISDIVSGWIQTDPVSFGFALYTENRFSRTDSYLSFKSRDTTDGPILFFEYYETEEDTTLIDFNRTAVYNTFINSQKPVAEYHQDKIRIANIIPTRSVFKLNIPESFFDLPAGLDLARITVNKAELVLFSSDDKHFSESFLQLTPYLLEQEYTPDSNVIIPKEEFLAISPTFTSGLSSTSDSVAVNVTSIVQAIVSDLKDNNGIVINSTQENFDNTYSEFETPESADPNKQPYLKIIYTLPLSE
jgi:protein involved in ribonucleotide reduction